MEKRDALFVLLALGGCGYGIYANWDTIAEKLDLHEFNLGELKAVDLAKESSDLSDGASNWQHIRSLQQRGMIEMDSNPWRAERISGPNYKVTVRWSDGGVPVAHGFAVNTAARTVQYQGRLENPAAPR